MKHWLVCHPLCNYEESTSLLSKQIEQKTPFFSSYIPSDKIAKPERQSMKTKT